MQRVVIADDREPEDRDDRIADDLLDRPAVRLEDQPHSIEVEGQDLAQRLRVELLAEGRGALEVRRDDGHGAPDLGRRLVADQQSTAIPAQSVGPRALLIASVARLHVASLRARGRPDLLPFPSSGRVPPGRYNPRACACSSVDRADGFGPSGRGFESCRARHSSLVPARWPIRPASLAGFGC